MCGIAGGPVDRARLMHYTFFSPKGLTLHKAGNSALTMFLNTRLYLYTNVYYHRTTRAIDLHLRDIFPDTMRVIFPGNPLEHMEEYLYLTDWSLLEGVSRWRRKKGEMEALAKEWETVLHREVKWKMAYDRTLSLNELHYGMALIQVADWEKRIRSALPRKLCAVSDFASIWRPRIRGRRIHLPWVRNRFTFSILPPVRSQKNR